METLLQNFLPSLVKDGVFGDVKFVSAKPESETDIGVQFASDLLFIHMAVESSKKGEEVLELVFKLPFSDKEERKLRNCDAMFFNEVTMYREILPFLGFPTDSYPKFYFGIATAGKNPDTDLLILENLKGKGFKPSKEKVFLDYDHISLAIRKIAEFHSFSYKLKQTNKEVFFQFSQKLKDVVLPQATEDEFGIIGYCSMERGFIPLLDNNSESVILKKCLNLLKSPPKLKKFLYQPEEPFAVICHGDFCNNNVLYKYDDVGKPVECVVFDFQMSLYTNPAIDLFFFLYMHTSSDFRNMYWDSIIKIYYDTLKSFLPNIIIPSFKEYLEHFSKRAIYGYTIASWFVPCLNNEQVMSVEEYQKLTLEEKISSFSTMGGQECQILVTEMVEHMLKKEYIKEFVNFCDENLFQP